MLAGALVGVLFFPLTHFFGIFLAVFGSVFPDMDHPKSFLGRYVPFFSAFFSHRGIFHSFWFLLVIGLLFSSSLYALVFILGMFTHLLLDGMTYQGICIPFIGRIRGFLRTGSFWEELFFIFLLVLLLFASIILIPIIF